MKTKSRPLSKPAAVPAAAAKNPWWPYGLGIFLAVFVLFQAYWPVLHGPFVFDDDHLPFRMPGFSDHWRLSMIGVRPLLMLSYWANFRLSGEDPFLYHLWNLLFHFGAALLVWRILDRLLERAGAGKPRRTVLAIFGGAIFLLHPVQTESVSYVASRSENLSVLLFLAALALFLKRPVAGWKAAAGILALFAGAVATKEHTLALPAVLLVTDYYWNSGFSAKGLRRNWRVYLPLAIAGAGGAAFVWRVLKTAATAGFGMKEVTPYEYLLTQFRALFVYLRLFVLPYGLHIDYDFPFSRSLADRGAAIGLGALLAISAAAWYWRRRLPLASYGWFFYLIAMAPTSSFVPIADPVAERRLYISMLGLLLIALEGLRRLPLRPAALAAALACVALAAGALTYNRNLIWADRVLLWEDAARKAANKPRVQFQLAYAYYDAGRCAEALPHYRRVSELQKPDYGLFVDWAQALDCAGRPEEALERIKQAAALMANAHVYSQLGMMYAKLSRWQEALDALAQAERIDPGFAMTYVYRGNIRESLNELEAARGEYRRALALEPDNPGATAAYLRLQRRLRGR